MKLKNIIKGTYTIDDNGYVNVEGNVYLSNKRLTQIPFKFGNVTGDFYCSYNQLTSLEYCPDNIGESFYCSHNQLTSLEHCPDNIGGDFSCNNNPISDKIKKSGSLLEYFKLEEETKRKNKYKFIFK